MLLAESQHLPVLGGLPGQMNARTSLLHRVTRPRKNVPSNPKFLSMLLVAGLEGMLAHPQVVENTPKSLDANEVWEMYVRKFPKGTQALMRGAMEKLKTRPPRKKAVLRAFLKVEPMDLPRNICPLPSDYQAIAGPLIMVMEKMLKHHPSSDKGLTQGMRDARLSQHLYSQAQGTDFSKFDMTVRNCHTQPFDRVQFTRNPLLLHQVGLGPLGHEQFAQYVKVVMAGLDRAKIRHVDGISLSLSERQCWSGEPSTGVRHSCNNFIFQVVCRIVNDLGLDCPSEVDPTLLIHRVREICASYDRRTWFSQTHGDDSIGNTPVRPQVIENVAAWFGWEATVEEGIPNVTGYLSRFLARDRTVADVRRSLVKYHLSASTPGKVNTPTALLVAKSLSYMATDHRTPLLGAVAWAHFTRNKHVVPAFSADASRRLDLRDISIDDVASLGPPKFNADLAVTVALSCGINYQQLERYHDAWVCYGLGGPMPPPLRLLSKVTKTTHLPIWE